MLRRAIFPLVAQRVLITLPPPLPSHQCCIVYIVWGGGDFLSALTQMRHPATVGPRRFTDVDRDLNVFHFCNSLIFTGVGYQPPA